MGENLVLNIESRGFTVSVFNRTTEKVTDFVNGRGKGKKIIPAYSLEELISGLSRPRKVMLMIKAGKPVDDLIEMIIPHLEKGDIIIEGGNSHFPDTIRRTEYVESKGLLYIGTGVSGGEEGALLGPSLMPGGSKEAWPHVKDIFYAIAARADDGAPCCTWIGDNGAGHFVKMAHNGIEYGDMQLICEAYHLLLSSGAFTYDQMADIFDEWNKAELDSYLIGITGEILRFKDNDGQPMVTKILDSAGQKGTGKWTVISALDHGVPLSLIGESVFARFISSMKKERVKASPLFSSPARSIPIDKKQFVDDIRKALYASKIISYAQGFNLLNRTSALENVELPLIYRGAPAVERRRQALQALETVGLKGWETHTPGELSGGQQQRVAIARAIVTGPAVLLADEPTGNLDTARSREIMELLTLLNRDSGITIIMVTHEPDMAAYAKRTIFFLDGLVASDEKNGREN